MVLLKSKKKVRQSYFCFKCGPFMIVIREVWSKNSESPDSIQLIQHEDMIPQIVDEIRLSQKPRRPAYFLAICGKCGAPVTTVCKAASMNNTRKDPF